MRPAGLIVACALTAIVVTEAAVFRVAGPTPGDTPLPDRALVVLIAAAFLIVASLALPRAQVVAWAAATLAAGLGSVEVVGAVRALEPFAGATWRELSAFAGIALVIAASVAAAFAARDWRSARAMARGWLVLVGVGTIATVAASIWAVVAADVTVEAGRLSPLRIAVRIGLGTTAGGFLVGIARDLGPAARNAYGQSRAQQASGRRLWSFVAGLVDQLLPGRLADRRVAAESERARLAADLHALVLPDLRRAAASAEAAGMPPEVQLDLRRALEDVEQLMHERQSIVLEQFGLVAALEWLAERTEERSPIEVELALDGDVPDRPDAVDPAVARAAFRIALLALDNVVRHAGATTATIRLSARGSDIRLAVSDDGTASEDRGGKGGRGIADMRAVAAASGGSIDVAVGSGIRVNAAWPRPRAAANHASPAAGVADRSESQAH